MGHVIGRIYVQCSCLHPTEPIPEIEFYVYAGTTQHDGETMYLFQDPEKYYWDSIINALPEEYRKNADLSESRRDMIMPENALGSMREIGHIEVFINGLRKHEHFEKYFGKEQQSSNQAL